MLSATHYVNADLEISSGSFLTALSKHFKSKSLTCLFCSQSNDGQWHTTIASGEQHDSAEPSIIDLLKAIESLKGEHDETWKTSSKRELNVGYQCGEEPWFYENLISNDTLLRIAKVGADLRITLYRYGAPAIAD